MRSPPLNHIYLWSGWIDKLNVPRAEARGHPHPLPEDFLRITHFYETILSILTILCPNFPWVILFQSYVRYVWGPIHHTCMSLFFSFLLIYKTRPNDFDLQLGCCISDAFSIFQYYFMNDYLTIFQKIENTKETSKPLLI